MEIKLTQVEVAKINLQPGEILAVTIKHDDISLYELNDLGKEVQKYFPNNKIMMFNVGTEGDMKFEIFASKEDATKPAASDCAEPTSYCNDCHCGKREQIEGAKS